MKIRCVPWHFSAFATASARPLLRCAQATAPSPPQSGATALHGAARAGNPELCTLLLQKGAKTNKRCIVRAVLPCRDVALPPSARRLSASVLRVCGCADGRPVSNRHGRRRSHARRDPQRHAGLLHHLLGALQRIDLQFNFIPSSSIDVSSFAGKTKHRRHRRAREAAISRLCATAAACSAGLPRQLRRSPLRGVFRETRRDRETRRVWRWINLVTKQ